MNKNVWEIADEIKDFLREKSVNVRSIKIDIATNVMNCRTIGVGVFYEKHEDITEFVHYHQNINEQDKFNIEAFKYGLYARFLSKSSPQTNIIIP